MLTVQSVETNQTARISLHHHYQIQRAQAMTKRPLHLTSMPKLFLIALRNAETPSHCASGEALFRDQSRRAQAENTTHHPLFAPTAQARHPGGS
jgi:hypothetical protein